MKLTYTDRVAFVKQNTPNLPIAANVVADLVEAGWPKGKQPQQATQH